MWKSKKDLAGHNKNTNSEFAEFLFHPGNFVSSPSDGSSNMKRSEEICLELDDGSSGSGSSKLLRLASI